MMNQDISIGQIKALKNELKVELQETEINSLVQEFYDKTGIRVDNISINWLDTSQYCDPAMEYRVIPGLIDVRYENIVI